MPKISFETDDENALNVSIETARLTLSSVKEGDLHDHYSQLFSDPDVMKLYLTGQPINIETVTEKIKTWTKHWETNDPFSAFSVRETENDEFVGQVELLHDEPGVAQLGYVFAKKNWGQGIASEAVLPVVKEYASELVKRNYQVEGKSFTTLFATARPDNPGSVKILEKAGMEYQKQEEKHGALRNFYQKKIA